MKRAIARKWAKALESGEYKQGTGQLRNAANEFCCLGVLCNMHAQANPELAAQQEDYSYFGESEFLPRIVQKWSGLNYSSGVFTIVEDDPYYGKNEVQEELSELNDRGKTFKYIAKMIRKHWKEL